MARPPANLWGATVRVMAPKDDVGMTKEPRDVLSERLTPNRLRAHLSHLHPAPPDLHTLRADDWQPFPPIGNREAWTALPESLRQELIRQGDAWHDYDWAPIRATTFLEFCRNGNRSRFEEVHFSRRHALHHLVVAECAEGNGRFLDPVINGIWAICEESFWGIPPHSFAPLHPHAGLPEVTYPVVDLFAAETGALLAWTRSLLGARIDANPHTAIVTDRIEHEVRTRLINPYRNVAWWPWLRCGNRPDNNWNPWIHSNLIACVLLIETDPEVRIDLLSRCISGIDVFLSGYGADGGCDEGTVYWQRAGASLFEALEWLHLASDGKLAVWDVPLVREIGLYLPRMHVSGDWYVNYADGAARVGVDADLAWRYGRRTGDPALSAHGAYGASLEIAHDRFLQAGGRAKSPNAPTDVHTLRRKPVIGDNILSIGRTLPKLFGASELGKEAIDARPPLIREAWLPDVQVLVARARAGDPRGLFVSARAGHNGDSHNHNDVGSFIVALDGHPVLVDVGVETYSAKTFGPERYSIWTMQSGYHNLPSVDGFDQSPGRQFGAREVACDVAAERVAMRMNLAGAYPAESGIRDWWRAIILDRDPVTSPDGVITISDAWDLATEAPHRLSLSLMVSGLPVVVSPGLLHVSSPGRTLSMTFEAVHHGPGSDGVGLLLIPEIEEILTTDPRLRRVWGDHIWRVRLHATDARSQGSWKLVCAVAE